EIVKNLQAKKSSPAAPPAAPTPAAAPMSGSQPVPVLVLPAPAPNPWEGVTEPEQDAPIAKVPESAKQSRAPWFIAGAVLGLLALVAVLAVVIIRIETAEGTLIVQLSDDADVEARVKGRTLVLTDKDGKERYRLSLTEDRDKAIRTGEYKIRVAGADGL